METYLENALREFERSFRDKPIKANEDLLFDIFKQFLLSKITTAHALGRKEALQEISKKCEGMKDEQLANAEGSMDFETSCLVIAAKTKNIILSTLQSFINELINKGV